jgi:hypothetical protein
MGNNRSLPCQIGLVVCEDFLSLRNHPYLVVVVSALSIDDNVQDDLITYLSVLILNLGVDPLNGFPLEQNLSQVLAFTRASSRQRKASTNHGGKPLRMSTTQITFRES